MVLPMEFMQDHIVCIASEFKGNEFLEEAHNAGWHVTLVTRQQLRDHEMGLALYR